MNKYMAIKSLFISRPALPVAQIATSIVFAAAMLFALSPASAEVKFEDDLNVEDELHCLALNIYHEARGEPELGKFAVANVTMNRVNDARFPKTVCDVVRQGGERRYRCQFTWWCDGRSDRPRDVRAWNQSKALAFLVYFGFARDATEGSLWYHADYVAPYWRLTFERGPKIGRHIFYRRNAERPADTSLASYMSVASRF